MTHMVRLRSMVSVIYGWKITSYHLLSATYSGRRVTVCRPSPVVLVEYVRRDIKLEYLEKKIGVGNTLDANFGQSC